MATPSDIWSKYKKCCCLVVLLHENGEALYKSMLYRMDATDTRDGEEIYRKLKLHKKAIKRKLLFPQKINLPPSACKVTDITEIDLSFLTHTIRVLDAKKDILHYLET